MKILTDSAADITKTQADLLDIEIVNIPVSFGKKEFSYDPEKDTKRFYEKLMKSKVLPVTSQPSPEDYIEIFTRCKDEQEPVLVVTLSSGLSGTYNAALLAKQIVNFDEIHIVDSESVIGGQRIITKRAVDLKNMGYKAGEIADYLNQFKKKVRVCGVVDTLTYMARGGRIPQSLSTIGNFLKIKPLIAMVDTKLESIGRYRGTKAAHRAIADIVKQSKVDVNYPLIQGYTYDESVCELIHDELKELFSDNIEIHSIGPVVGTHTGPYTTTVSFVEMA